MIIPSQIRAARALIGWTQAKLASASGVSEVSIKGIERGTTDPRSKTLAAIIAALGDQGVEFTNGGQPGVRLKPLKIGDRVRLVKGTMTWGGLPDVRDLVGEIAEFVDDGTALKRVIVKFPNGHVTAGMDIGLFQRA